MTTLLDKRDNPGAKPAFGDHAHDVEAVNAKDKRSQYAVRQKIYPKLADGWFRSVKWFVMAITLGVYYALPWLRWHRGPDLPDQAVLLDMANNRFFFFFLEIWPQEFYYVTGLLLLASLALFLVTSAAGRVWCGYSCPQTVWTDLMIMVERLWQGDRNQRIRLDKEPWGAAKIFKKSMTHLSWMLIGLLTGGAMVFYFRDAPTLARELVTGTAPAIAYLFLAIFTATTYVLGGIAREQVCIYMCPWPRIQGAMTDQHTLLVGYRVERGEPRGPARKGADGSVDWSTRGDCIDCKACVAVCPTGIDIRDGSQLECIQCALCIDACDGIMDKIGRPRGLIAYDTVARKEAASARLKDESVKHEPVQLIRPRTMLYAGLLALVGIVMLIAWSNRTVLELNVIADRNPPYVRLSSGAVRNGFTIKILNKLHEPRTYSLAVSDLPGATLTVLGMEGTKEPAIVVPTDVLREIRVFVAVPAPSGVEASATSRKFRFIVKDKATGLEVVRAATFQGPAPSTGSLP